MARKLTDKQEAYKIDAAMWDFKQDPDYWKVPGYFALACYMVTSCLIIFGVWHC